MMFQICTGHRAIAACSGASYQLADGRRHHPR
jgi:hypothetical protein